MKVLILNTCWSTKSMTTNYPLFFFFWTETPAHVSSIPVACRVNATASSLRVPPNQYSPYPHNLNLSNSTQQKKKKKNLILDLNLYNYYCDEAVAASGDRAEVSTGAIISLAYYTFKYSYGNFGNGTILSMQKVSTLTSRSMSYSWP